MAHSPGDRDLYEWARETGSVWAESMTRAIVGHWGPLGGRVAVGEPAQLPVAALTLTYLLATERIVLDEVGPVAQIQRSAGDVPSALALAGLVAALIKGTLRRSTAGRHS